MKQLKNLKVRLGGLEGQDELLKLLLDDAGEIICNIRNTDIVEDKYLNVQARIAVEMFNKMGAEGQTGHTEHGLSRSYENGDVSESLLRLITPVISTPASSARKVKVIR